MQYPDTRIAATVSMACAFILVVGASLASAQDAMIQSGMERVVVDGDFIRIQDGNDEVTISGDWRNSGSILTETETEKVVIELGGVVVDSRIQLNLAGDILFDFDSTEIKPAAAAKLAQAAQVVRARSVGEVHIIGHTDAKGEDAYNMTLSQKRAVAVMRHLAVHEGIPTKIMVGSGVGSKYPIAHNTMPDGSDDPDGRAKNRRVEIQMATREGVKIGPGLVTVGPDRITTPEAVIDAGGVTTDEVHVDTGAGGVVITENDDEDKPASAEIANAAPAGGGSGACEKLCMATAGKHTINAIRCVEGTFEELDYDMDEGSCNELEGAMLLGTGNEGGRLCKQCQRDEGFTDAQCDDVLKACFP